MSMLLTIKCLQTRQNHSADTGVRLYENILALECTIAPEKAPENIRRNSDE